MDKQDLEVVKSLSEPAKKLFYSLDRNSQKIQSVLCVSQAYK